MCRVLDAATCRHAFINERLNRRLIMSLNKEQTRTRGFASMDPDRQREIASSGGKAAHASGNAHEFDSSEAREAGKKSHGGQSQNSAGGGSDASRTQAKTSVGIQGGTSEQHAAAGRQSHKNDPR
jgi:general stress protein YciG